MGLDLITLAEYKAYKGITNPNDDAALSSLITKASSLVKSVCNRTFVDYVDTVKVDTSSGSSNYHYFSEYPVLSLQSVEYSDDYGKTYVTLEEYVDYIYDQEKEAVLFIHPQYTNSVSKPNKFKISFTAGYETVPEDLKLAVCDIVTYYLRNDGALHTQRTPGSNTVLIDYVTNNRLPAHIARILELYMAHYG